MMAYVLRACLMWSVQTVEKEAKKEVEDALAKAKVCNNCLDVVGLLLDVPHPFQIDSGYFGNE